MSYQFKLPPVPRTLRPEDRYAIEAQIEALIALLDADDGDPDFEPEDDLGIDDMPHDQEHPLVPAYGIDQSAGPVNHAIACQAYDLAERRRDYERTGMFDHAKKITARVVSMGHPSISH